MFKNPAVSDDASVLAHTCLQIEDNQLLKFAAPTCLLKFALLPGVRLKAASEGDAIEPSMVYRTQFFSIEFAFLSSHRSAAVSMN